jgi:hypothetical protein
VNVLEELIEESGCGMEPPRTSRSRELEDKRIAPLALARQRELREAFLARQARS